MKQDDLESVYEALAEAIDAVGPEQSETYLAKVALALAESLGSTAESLTVIEECKTGFADAGSIRGNTGSGRLDRMSG